MNERELKEILKEHNIGLSKRFSQHFLIDEDVAKRKMEYGNIGSEDIVLEIGAGVGNLTEKIEKKAKRVYAVEKDRRFCKILKERCDNSKTEIIEGDFMKIELPEFDKVIANVPYSFASPITYRLLLHGFNFAILIYQEEFVMKMTAKPMENRYGRLSVVTQALADIEILEKIPHNAFYPPSVDSLIVKLIEKKEMEEEEKKFFFDFVNAVFMQKRKKMRNIIEHYVKGEAAEFKHFIDKLDKRPEELSPKAFVKIAKHLIK